jgi:hypothetical protein
MTTIDVQTAISPAVLFRLYATQAKQDMYGGGNHVAVSSMRPIRSFEGSGYNVGSMTGLKEKTGGAVPYGFVQFPVVTDQSATANQVPPLDWYPYQYVASLDDAKKERQKAEYAGFYEQWVRATLSNYK